MYLIGSLELGGAESQLTKLMLKCHEQGLHCALFVLESGGYFQARLEEQGIPVYDGGYSRQYNRAIKFLLLIKAWFLLLKIIIQEKPTVLHAYLPMPNFMGATAGKLMRVKLIITSRRALGTHQDRYPLWKLLRLDRLINKLSDYVTVNSQAVWEDVIKRDHINPAKLVLITNGLDTQIYENAKSNTEAMRHLLGLPDHWLGIIMVGNLRPCKGHEVVLKALSEILPTEKNLKIYFVGQDVGRQSQLQQLAKNLGVSDHVIYLGRRDDIPALLSAMDIYIMASFEEGSSNALLEAMAAGLPIIATDVGGNKEALDNGQAGILIPPKDATALARALLTLISNKEQCQHLGALAQASVKERYSIDKMVSSHIKLYNHAT